MAVWPLDPTTNTVPSGRSTWGPISWLASDSCTGVVPAGIQVSVCGRYLSAPRKDVVSIVRIEPSGYSVQPSSSLLSDLPVPGSRVHVRVSGSRLANWQQPGLNDAPS